MNRLSTYLPGKIVPAFSPLTDEALGAAAGLPEPSLLPSGTILIEQEQRPRFVGLIRSGIVKLEFTGEEGDSVTLGLRSTGWWVNADVALLDVPCLCSVMAVTDVEMIKLSVSDFSQRLFSNPELMKEHLLAQCQELLMVQQHRIMLGRSATERLRHLLGEHSQSIWETSDPTRIMRQSDIAELLSITPEHLSRVRSSMSRPRRPGQPSKT